MIRIAIVYLAAYAMIVDTIVHAPLGYEDSDGFHYGRQPQ